MTLHNMVPGCTPQPSTSHNHTPGVSHCATFGVCGTCAEGGAAGTPLRASHLTFCHLPQPCCAPPSTGCAALAQAPRRLNVTSRQQPAASHHTALLTRHALHHHLGAYSSKAHYPPQRCLGPLWHGAQRQGQPAARIVLLRADACLLVSLPRAGSAPRSEGRGPVLGGGQLHTRGTYPPTISLTGGGRSRVASCRLCRAHTQESAWAAAGCNPYTPGARSAAYRQSPHCSSWPARYSSRIWGNRGHTCGAGTPCKCTSQCSCGSDHNSSGGAHVSRGVHGVHRDEIHCLGHARSLC